MATLYLMTRAKVDSGLTGLSRTTDAPVTETMRMIIPGIAGGSGTAVRSRTGPESAAETGTEIAAAGMTVQMTTTGTAGWAAVQSASRGGLHAERPLWHDASFAARMRGDCAHSANNATFAEADVLLEVLRRALNTRTKLLTLTMLCVTTAGTGDRAQKAHWTPCCHTKRWPINEAHQNENQSKLLPDLLALSDLPN